MFDRLHFTQETSGYKLRLSTRGLDLDSASWVSQVVSKGKRNNLVNYYLLCLKGTGWGQCQQDRCP